MAQQNCTESAQIARDCLQLVNDTGVLIREDAAKDDANYKRPQSQSGVYKNCIDMSFVYIIGYCYWSFICTITEKDQINTKVTFISRHATMLCLQHFLTVYC